MKALAKATRGTFAAALTPGTNIDVDITGAGYLQYILIALDSTLAVDTASDQVFLELFIDGETTASTSIRLRDVDYSDFVTAASDTRPVDWIIRDQTNFIHAITLNSIYHFNTSIKVRVRVMTASGGGATYDALVMAPAVLQ